MSHKPRIDLRTVKLPSTPNWHLMAPEGYCLGAKPHTKSPVFDATRGTLWEVMIAAVAQEARVTVHADDREEGYYDFTQRSFFLRFPDRVVINVLPGAKPSQSTLAILSRARYGRSDLGVNRARVERLISRITQKLA